MEQRSHRDYHQTESTVKNQVMQCLWRVHIRSCCGLKCYLTYIYVAQNTGAQTGYSGAREKEEIHELESKVWPNNTKMWCLHLFKITGGAFNTRIWKWTFGNSALSEFWACHLCVKKKKTNNKKQTNKKTPREILFMGWGHCSGMIWALHQCKAVLCENIKAEYFSGALVQCRVCKVVTVSESTMIFPLSKTNKTVISQWKDGTH